MNETGNIFQLIDEMIQHFMKYMIGSSIAIFGFSYLFWGDYNFRIVLNFIELIISILGSIFAFSVLNTVYIAYIGLHSSANGIKYEMFYKFGLSFICLSLSVVFFMLLIDWMAKALYNNLDPVSGIKWSLWEYHAQRIINCVLLDTLSDILLMVSVRLSNAGKIPKIGHLAITKGFMSENEVSLVILKQQNIRDKRIKEYIKSIIDNSKCLGYNNKKIGD